MRPGEKLTEKVFSDAEERVPSVHPKIWATRRTEPPPDFPVLLGQLYAAARNGDDDQVRTLLADLVREYQPAQELPSAIAIASPYPDEF